MKAMVVFMATLLASSAAFATGLYDQRSPRTADPFETRRDAYERQQNEDYNYRQRDPYQGLTGGRQEPLGDSRVQPDQRELNSWYGSKKYGRDDE